jgi:hypothetical protein
MLRFSLPALAPADSLWVQDTCAAAGGIDPADAIVIFGLTWAVFLNYSGKAHAER